jgi:hypothetical protein
LHLQLNLVDLQFVDEALRVGFGPGLAPFRVLLPQALFGAAAQFGCSGGGRFLLHGVPVSSHQLAGWSRFWRIAAVGPTAEGRKSHETADLLGKWAFSPLKPAFRPWTAAR